MKHGFSRFFLRSVSGRKGRIIIAIISVTLSVAMVTGMIGITAGVGEKLGEELKAYGANIMVAPREGDYLGYEVLEKISVLEGVQSATGQIFGSAVFSDNTIEIIGLEITNLKDRGWRLNGRWPERKGEIVAGVNLKNALKLDLGRKIYLVARKRMSAAEIPSSPGISDISGGMDFVITGFVERGGSEDNSFVMTIQDASDLMGVNRQLSAVLARSASGTLDEIVQRINSMIPEAQAKTFRQVAFAEQALLRKIQLLMLLVTAVVLSAAIISVASTMGANVLERREEIGLMKALGATKRQINMFYRTEAIVTGLAGGIAGFISGYFFTQAISNGAFNSYVPVPGYTFFISLFFGVMISAAASYLPVRNALKYNPAVILRGE